MKEISLTSLSKIRVEGGDVFHGYKKSDLQFNGFGEIYYSWIDFGFIKAWKKHNQMTMNLVVPYGSAKFVFFAKDMKTKLFETTIGEENYSRITVPPGIWFGFMGKHKDKSLITNISNIEHSDIEVEKKNISAINYKW